MGLADYKPPTRVIEVSGGSFQVKGLSLTEFSVMVQHHLPDLEAIFDLGMSVADGKADLDESDVTKLAVAFAKEAPGFVANLIALASGEADDERTIEAARALPFPTQVKALVEIANLTFAEVGGIKKGMESVVGLLKTKPEVVKKVKAAIR